MLKQCRLAPVAYAQLSIHFGGRIHERTISVRFLCIILRVLRLEVSVWISETIGKGGVVFYQAFLLSPLQYNT